MSFITEFFARVFDGNVALATIIIAMVPIVELRGAIPFATNSTLWGKLALSNWKALGWSLLGSTIIVPILALVLIPIINWLKRTKFFGKLATAIENRIRNKANSLGDGEVNKKFTAPWWKKVLAVFVFVAIPLPLTGVWTGSCVALFLGLDYVTSCLTVISGNIVAGVAIALILQFFPWLNDYLLWIFLAIVAVIVIYEIICHFVKKKKQQSNDINNNSNNDNSGEGKQK